MLNKATMKTNTLNQQQKSKLSLICLSGSYSKLIWAKNLSSWFKNISIKTVT